MNNMWSNKKYLNNIINVLIFLVFINFMHIGQLFLPIICLILFIENKYKLKINNWFIFIILCIFSLTYYLFSYQLGLYGLIAFCLPMAYYIGSNLYTNESNIKKLIYIIGFGMAVHLVLNFFLQLYLFKFDLPRIFNKVSFYDIWLSIQTYIKGIELYINGRMKSTQMSIYYLFILACVYYLIKYENNKKYKIIGLITFILATIFCFALGRRTFLLLFAMIFCFSIFYEIFFIKKSTINKNKLFTIIFILLALMIICILLIYFNIFNLKDILFNIKIFQRIFIQGLNSGRLDNLIDSLKYYPKCLWGGQHISEILGLQIHNLWGDIYDYAGIVPFISMFIYTIYCIVIIFKHIKSNNYSKSFKLIIFNIFICSFALMLLEPLMTGSTIFVIAVIIFVTIIEKGLI